MLIQNYGLFWKVGDVFWGKPAVTGHLMGVPASNTTATPVDFREQIGVYVLYANYDLVYVGQVGTGNQRLFDRFKQHRRDALAERWNQFSWFGIRRVKKNGELSQEADATHSGLSYVLNHIEAILIHTVEPRHNRQGGRFGEEVIQYLQYRDGKALGPTVDEMIQDLWKKGNEG
ncbi:MAG: GIY-YIG nuclease family protein [Gammaproteobacteria bacterium]